MSEEIITTRRGLYGRVNITLPLITKTTMLTWAKRSGMKKAEFLRLALTMGFLALRDGFAAAEAGPGAEAVPPASASADGRPAPK